MALTWIPVLLTCLGGATACMTDQGCANFHNQSMAALTANKLEEYCRLSSRSISCYAFDSTGCPNPDQILEPMYTGYYNTCSLTVSDVNSCKRQTVSCGTLLSEPMTSLSNSDIVGYCSAMEPYLTCVKQSMTGCNNKVTIYDVLGPVHGTYDKFCSSVNNNDKTAVCQGIIFRAGCHTPLTNISDSLTSQDFSQYCSLMDDYMKCMDQAFATCDQTVSKETLMPGMDQQYQQFCQGSPVQACQMKTYSCYPKVAEAFNNTGNPTLLCSGMKGYFNCVNESMKTCDRSLKRSDVIGQSDAMFNLLCGAGGRGYCPGVSTCMQPLMSTSSTSTTQQTNAVQGGQPNMLPPNPNVMGECSKLGDLMICMDTELGKCNISSPRSYTLKDVGELYITGCQKLMSNTALQTCSQMTECMATQTFPTDPIEITHLYYDPKFWCSQMKSTMACAESSKQCQADRTEITALLGEVNQLCQEAKAPVTDSGNSSHIVRAGILMVLSVISVVLLSRQL